MLSTTSSPKLGPEKKGIVNFSFLYHAKLKFQNFVGIVEKVVFVVWGRREDGLDSYFVGRTI
jgi:hypothetical protein